MYKRKYSGEIRITNKERTVIDSIKDMDKISGLEEVLSNIDEMTRLNEDKLINALCCYQNQFLYQKTGLILKHYQNKFSLSDHFFEVCKIKTGRSKRYLVKGCTNGKYNKEWKLIVPQNIFNMKNEEFMYENFPVDN